MFFSLFQHKLESNLYLDASMEMGRRRRETLASPKTCPNVPVLGTVTTFLLASLVNPHLFLSLAFKEEKDSRMVELS